MKTLLFAILFLAACTTVEMADTDVAVETMDDSDQKNDVLMDESDTMMVEIDWMNVELTDVNSEETYTIGQFDGPIFVESFAVWCPTCTRQQKELKKFHETNPEVVSITLDTDPNEDATKVKEHADANGFDWRYSVSPAELTQGLIDEFGLGVVNAPAVPVILICPDKSNRLLGRGVKDQIDLAAAIASCEAA